MAQIYQVLSLGKKMLLICLGFIMLVPASLVANNIVAHAKAPVPKVTVSPTPQQMIVKGNGFPLTPVVGLVTGKQTDSSAIQEVVKVLHAHNVKRIVQKHADEPAPATAITIWLGSPSSNQGSAKALKSLGVKGPQDLKSEGYVLASGHNNHGKKTIVLAGKDNTGTFYAAQTFRQIITKHPGRDWVPAVKIRDWPQMGIRGVIEGFYGKPWSHQERLNQIAFYGRNKLNTYVYAPKDDPYHRDKWRVPYPKQRLKQLSELVQKAKQNHVRFVFAVSPGKSVCYSSDSDYQALTNKMQTMYNLGVRSFALFFDDISSNLRCSQDKAKFGNASSPSAAAQSYLLNRFDNQFIHTHPGTKRLISVPTEYYQSGETPYRNLFANQVNSDIITYWTGIGVVAPTITGEDADKIHKIFKHDLLTWDNYPVNDYTTNRLLLGPLVGRAPDLSKHHVLGMTANPMIEAEASKIPLFTVADYAWNSDAYNPQKSWERSIKAFGGTAAQPLKIFAENSYSSALNQKESPELTPVINQFWNAYGSGDFTQTGQALYDQFQKIEQAPGQLRAKLDNKEFLKETAPWLNKLELYGKAGKEAVKMLMAQKANNGEAAWQQRMALDKTFAKAKAIPQQMAPGVIKPFLEKAISKNNNWLGVSKTTAISSMPAYSTYQLANMLDGNTSNFYWSDRAAHPGDYVGVDLGAVFKVNKVNLMMGSTSGPETRPNDYIHQGVLEYSTDGSNWHTLMKGDNQRDIQLNNLNIKARYIRYRATADQINWVQVHEFDVISNKGSIQVSGGPPAVDSSNLAAAADGDVTTAYQAKNAPNAGDALVFKISHPETLHHVVVLQDPKSPAKAKIQLENQNGDWTTVGELIGGYTSVKVSQSTDKVRLLWADGTSAPKIYEVIPKK